MEAVQAKTFYIETFGCQMNAHDSEKVVGTLLAQGYSQVEAPADAELVLYNTCSIRDKAEQKVFNRLQQFKRYPSEAQSSGEEGVVMLSFSVDRNGRVLAHKIVHSSGYPALDAEVTSMIERAQPLPAFPPSMTQASLDLTVPIRFSLR